MKANKIDKRKKNHLPKDPLPIIHKPIERTPFNKTLVFLVFKHIGNAIIDICIERSNKKLK